MTRIAILSDIHGNSIALQAVLDDIQLQEAVDAYWVLGDLAAVGHDPIRVLETLSQLPNLRCIRGNTDSYVMRGKPPLPPVETMLDKPEGLPDYMHAVANFAWTQGALMLTGWTDWLKQLPLELRQTLPDGTRCLGVHAAPGTDDGPGISPATSEETLAAYAKEAQVDLICVGHTHWPLDLQVGGVRFFNPGSVSNPITDDLHASYAILNAEPSGYRIERHCVDYDHQAVIAAVRTVNHPAADFIIRYQLGKNKPPWVKS